MAYSIIHFGDMLQKLGENQCIEVVANFSCPKDIDIENFLKNTAICNQKMNISRTYLVYTSFENNMILVGYYSIAIKPLTLNCDISKTLKRKITGFKDVNVNGIPVFLLGQMGKNFQNGYDKLITGQELFGFAIKSIKDAQRIVGGKAVLVECKNEDVLKNFYEGLGFTHIDEDSSDGLLKYIALLSRFETKAPSK